MFTVGQVRETLELSDLKEADDAMTSLNLLAYWPGSDLVLFDLKEYNRFYSDIHKNISHVLGEFRKTPYGLKRASGLTVDQIGKALDKMGEPWPNITIAMTIQYQILAIENKFSSVSDIMGKKFSNLDVRQDDILFHA